MQAINDWLENEFGSFFKLYFRFSETRLTHFPKRKLASWKYCEYSMIRINVAIGQRTGSQAGTGVWAQVSVSKSEFHQSFPTEMKTGNKLVVKYKLK